MFDELPAPQHCGIQEQKQSEAFYGKDGTTIDCTNQCNRVLQKKLKGLVFRPPIKIVDSNDGTTTFPLSQFVCPTSTYITINPIKLEED